MANPFLGFLYVLMNFTAKDWIVGASAASVALAAVIFVHRKFVGKVLYSDVINYSFVSLVIGLGMAVLTAI